jgi:uncharacterized protein involved in exopolysaccharide biosynthesis
MADKLLIAVSVVIAVVLALSIAILSTPIYRAEILLAPVESQSRGPMAALAGRFGGLAEFAGITLPSEGTRVDNALAILESREFLIRFIEEEGIKPLLFPGNWDSQKKTWFVRGPSVADRLKVLLGLTPQTVESSDLVPGEPSALDAYEIFDKDILRVSRDSETGLVTVAIETEYRMLAPEWANRLVQRLNADLRARAIDRATKSIEYLRQQSEETSLADLRSALFRLIEEQIQTITLAKVNDEFVFEILDPAVAPDPDDEISPKRLLILLLGGISGLLVGILAALLRGARAVRTQDHP